MTVREKDSWETVASKKIKYNWEGGNREKEIKNEMSVKENKDK